jgi:uncharacterized protein YaaN involved in tellurite resistance
MMEIKKEATKEMINDVSKLIKKEDLEKLNQDAENMVERMKPAEYDDLHAIMDQLANLGGKEQQTAGESLSNLRRPVKDMMDNSNNTEVPDNLLKLRSHVNELNPESLQKSGVKGIVNRILRRNSLDKYISKYESVEKNIEVIVKGLLRGQDKIQEDNADLEIIKRDSQEKIYSLEKQIYFGNQLFEILENKKKDAEWAEKSLIIMEAQEKVIVRTKNMSMMVNVLHQSMASVDIIKKNNDKLKEAIRNAIDTTKNIAPVTAAIHMALGNQKTLINAINNVNEATENMLTANAKMLKENTEETSKLLENPTISIEKLQQAFNDIYSAIETQEASSRKIIENSKEYVDKMDTLNTDIKKKLGVETLTKNS